MQRHRILEVLAQYTLKASTATRRTSLTVHTARREPLWWRVKTFTQQHGDPGSISSAIQSCSPISAALSLNESPFSWRVFWELSEMYRKGDRTISSCIDYGNSVTIPLTFEVNILAYLVTMQKQWNNTTFWVYLRQNFGNVVWFHCMFIVTEHDKIFTSYTKIEYVKI